MGRAPSAATSNDGLALVLSGGGARAAYQVGVLRFMARRFPHAVPEILTGVSAGAFNAALLAAHEGSNIERVHDLVRTWRGLTMEQVFRVDVASLGLNAVRWLARLASGGSGATPPTRGLVDTTPLFPAARRAIASLPATAPVSGLRPTPPHLRPPQAPFPPHCYPGNVPLFVMSLSQLFPFQVSKIKH